MDKVAYLIYNLLITIGFPFIAVYYFSRLWKRGMPPSGLKERLGILRRLPSSIPEERLWLHAVSVGEVGVVQILLPALRKENPSLRVVVSTVTETGREAAEKLEGIEYVFYLPFDYPLAVRAALTRIQPSVLAMVETELWPNLIREASLRGISVLVINGRLSEKSFQGYKRLRFLFLPALKFLSGVSARGKDDAERFRKLGVKKIVSVGNIKYDSPLPSLDTDPRDLRRKYGLGDADPVLVAGSTHPGEEKTIGEIFCSLREKFPRIGLLLAPRHLPRLREVEETLHELRLSPSRWSELSGENRTSSEGDRVVILDRMGLLGEAYACGTVAFIGGSLIPHGGQNLIEAARWGVPVVFGPHMENFSEVADEVLKVGGAVRAEDSNDLEDSILEWFSDKSARDRAGASARNAVMANRGSAERTSQFLMELFPFKSGFSE